MVPTISVYETNLNARRERDRRRNVVPGHVVYIIGKPRIDSFKVGRTKDFSGRMYAYKSYLGEDIAALVQIEVADKDAAKQLEREFISALKCAEARRGREWFKMPYPELAALIKGVLQETDVSVVNVRGAPCAVQSKLVMAAESAAMSNLVLPQRRRGRRQWDF